MNRPWRALLIVLTVLSFLVTSTGWGVASGAMAGSSGHHGAAQSCDGRASHAEGASDHQHGECGVSDASGAADEHGSDEPASSCCAMACHAAIEADGWAGVSRLLGRSVRNSILHAGVKEASLLGFERPPRAIGL